MIYKILKEQIDFNETEKMLANYILLYAREVIFDPIDVIAKKSYISPSSIVRFSKKLGCSGFTDLKITLASQLHHFDKMDEQIAVDMPLLPDSDIPTILKTFWNLSTQSLDYAYQNLNQDKLQEAVQLIDEADSITVLGNGLSHLVALNLHYNLKRIGYNSTCDSVVGFQSNIKSKDKNVNQVTVIVSSFATSDEVRKWIMNAKKIGSKIILITTSSKTPFTLVVDTMLSVDMTENHVWKIGAFATKTILTYVTDCLYSTLFNAHYLDNIKHLYDAAHYLGYGEDIDIDTLEMALKQKK